MPIKGISEIARKNIMVFAARLLRGENLLKILILILPENWVIVSSYKVAFALCAHPDNTMPMEPEST
jgi:hypothetical protein